MDETQSMILLEFNELTPTVIDRYVSAGHLPNFARFQSESHVFTTDAEETGERLNPWIQWVTVHSGLSYDEHGIFHLNEGHKLQGKRVWDVLSDAGYHVWLCGSMNIHYRTPFNGAVLPDPWSTTVEPYPDAFDPYFRFVQTQVQEHTNESVPLKPADYVRFLTFMMRHGMSASTVRSILAQLLQERSGDGKWRRVALLDKLQWDVFRWYFRKHRPHFSTFFLNSTAHLQHAYWRYMEPDHFQVKPTPEERARYEGAVLFGYQEMDRLLGQIMELAGGNTTLVLATALGQQPCTIYEEGGGKRFYRPRNLESLLEFAGVDESHDSSPVMSEQFHVYFESPADRESAEQKLRALTVNGRPVMRVEPEDSTGIFTGCAIFDEIASDARIAGAKGERPFFDLFYKAETVKSGMHHPDGALWIRTPDRSHSVREGRVPLRAVAPTLLTLLGVEPPAHMSAAPLALEPATVA